MSHAITSSIDTAQVVLYLFWIFFFGLVIWIRREDRREGYPLESEALRVVGPRNDIRIPPAKTFLLPHDEGERKAPDFVRDEREVMGEKVSRAPGFPIEPVGEPLLSGVGPASFAQRSDHPELSHEDDKPVVVPMRAANGYSVSAGPDPRGWTVLGADEGVVGTISDIWVDRADLMVRYLEIELPTSGVPETMSKPESKPDSESASQGESEDADDSGADAADGSSSGASAASSSNLRLIPISMLDLDERVKAVRVRALKADQFTHVPTLAQGESITLLEEEKVSAFYAGGWFYAEPNRREALL